MGLKKKKKQFLHNLSSMPVNIIKKKLIQDNFTRTLACFSNKVSKKNRQLGINRKFSTQLNKHFKIYIKFTQS